MKKRPTLSISVCGIATRADESKLATQRYNSLYPENPTGFIKTGSDIGKKHTIAANMITKSTLLRLAEQRAEKVRQFLLETNDISADRILDCKPRYNRRKDIEPSVWIKFD
jgi:hypothetical protein